MPFRPFAFLQRQAPISGPDNAQLSAYQRTQAPPRVLFTGAGRLVQGDCPSYSPALISIGYGAPVNAVIATQLGPMQTPGYTPLINRRMIGR